MKLTHTLQIVWVGTRYAQTPRRLFRTLTTDEYKQLILYILPNSDEVDPLLSAFDMEHWQGMNYNDLQTARAAQFVDWFRDVFSARMFSANRQHEDLARGLARQVQQYKMYKVNG